MHSDEHWMQQALKLAQHAATENEVPVGAVLVLNNEIIGEGWNRPISTNDPTAHAEIIALREGAKHVGNYRLLNTTLYVTLEPCIMCVGAMVHARIKRLVYGAPDPKTGAVHSVFNILNTNKLNHQIDCVSNVTADACGAVLREFFSKRR